MTALSLEPNVQVSLITAGATIAVALIGVLVELVRRQSSALSEVAENVQVAREHVANTHETNLRDDLDRVIAGLDQVLEGQRKHSEEIGELRKDIAHERRERLAVSERLDDHIAASAA